MKFVFLPMMVLQMTIAVDVWASSSSSRVLKASKKNPPPPPPPGPPGPPGPPNCDACDEALAECDGEKNVCDTELEYTSAAKDKCEEELFDCQSKVIVPKAPLLSDITIAPTQLEDVGCDDVNQFSCDDTEWVYCIDAACGLPDENGLSTCDCIKQSPSESKAPGTAESGATCVYQKADQENEIQKKTNILVPSSGLYGQAMCDAMKDGALISTFGALSESPNAIPPFADQPCPADTTWLYCWGAACTQNEEDMEKRGPNAVQCQCPYVQSPEVNIQIETSQCAPEQKPNGDGICNYLHNGNPSSETDLAALILPTLELDIVPTCESYVPAVNLEQIDCASGTGFNTTSRWVYCIDAICTPPANGFSNCYCWIQEASVSVGPGAANAGASCVQRFLEQDSEPPVTGEALEAAMADGELYSTFGVYGASSFVPDMKAGLCDPFNPFQFCWGAKCEPDPKDPDNRAICRCPYVTTSEATIMGVRATDCPEQGGDVCNFDHNGGLRDWDTFKQWEKFVAEGATCGGPCNITFPIGQLPEDGLVCDLL